MAYRLIGPTRDTGLAGVGRLFGRITTPQGVTLLVTGKTVREAQYPSDVEFYAADFAYVGGHIYTISDEEAQTLIDAGYGDYVEEIT